MPNFEAIVLMTSENRKGAWRQRGVIATYPDEWIKAVAASVNTLPAGSEKDDILQFLTAQFAEYEEKFWAETEREADLGGPIYLA